MTQLVYSANLNSKFVKPYLERLISAGLLSREMFERYKLCVDYFVTAKAGEEYINLVERLVV